jgi:hypothetical protein
MHKQKQWKERKDWMKISIPLSKLRASVVKILWWAIGNNKYIKKNLLQMGHREEKEGRAKKEEWVKNGMKLASIIYRNKFDFGKCLSNDIHQAKRTLMRQLYSKKWKIITLKTKVKDKKEHRHHACTMTK